MAECRDGIRGGWMWTPYLCWFLSSFFLFFFSSYSLFLLLLFFKRSLFACRIYFFGFFVLFCFFLSLRTRLSLVLFPFLHFIAHRVLFGLSFCLLDFRPIHSLDLFLFLHFGIISVRFSFYPGQRRQMWYTPSAAPDTSTSLKQYYSWPVIHPVGSDRGITHFLTVTRNTTEGVGEKEQANNMDLGQLQVQEG